MGLGANGNPLTNVAANLPSSQPSGQNQGGQGNMFGGGGGGAGPDMASQMSAVTEMVKLAASTMQMQNAAAAAGGFGADTIMGDVMMAFGVPGILPVGWSGIWGVQFSLGSIHKTSFFRG